MVKTPVIKKPGARAALAGEGQRNLPAGNLQSLERAISLVRATADSDAGLTLTELSGAVGLSKSTAHRILSALVDPRLLRLSAEPRVYTPGSELYRLGMVAAKHFPLVDIARPHLHAVARATEDTVFLSVIDGREAVCLDRVIGDFPIKTLTLSVGARRPLGVGAGSLALLAALPDGEAKGIIREESLRLPAYKGFTRSALNRLVREVHERGFAHIPEYIVPGMSAIGVAIRGPDARPAGAISVAAITPRMSEQRIRTIYELVSKECEALADMIASFKAGPASPSMK